MTVGIDHALASHVGRRFLLLVRIRSAHLEEPTNSKVIFARFYYNFAGKDYISKGC